MLTGSADKKLQCLNDRGFKFIGWLPIERLLNLASVHSISPIVARSVGNERYEAAVRLAVRERV